MPTSSADALIASPTETAIALPLSADTDISGEINHSTLPQGPEEATASVEIGNGKEHQETNHCPEHDASKNDNQQHPDIENDTDNDLLEGSKEAHKAFLEFFEQLERSFHPQGNYSRSARGVRRLQDKIQEYEARMPLKWRIGQARKLSFVITAYFRLLEDRLFSLESQTPEDGHSSSEGSSSDNNNGEGSDEEGSDNDDEANNTIPTLNRVPWPEFKTNFEENKEPSQKHAIDVLMDNPVIPLEVWTDQIAKRRPQHLVHFRRRMRPFQFEEQLIFGDFDDPDAALPKTRVEPSKSTTTAQPPRDAYSPIPDRIRINGKSLQLLLEKALEVDLGSPIVFLKPFKVLVKYDGQIRSLHQQLEKKFLQDCAEPTSSNMPEPSHTTGSRYSNDDGKAWNSLLDEYGTKQALRELSCLVEFMNKDLLPLRSFVDCTATKIAFSDLWHIFQAGVAVVTATKPIEAYRVLHVTGGRPYLSPPEDEENDEEVTGMKVYKVPAKSSDFIITCYQVGFDGDKFGPIAKSFSIQKYNGLQDIRLLPIYPMSFAKGPEELSNKLCRNGKIFIKLSKVGHVLYRGPNLHEAEEIDSEIIIDFRAALWDNQEEDNGWKEKYQVQFGIPTLPNANEAEVTMISRGGCKESMCCENDKVFNDLDLDRTFLEEYLAKNEFLTTDTRYLTDDPRHIPEDDLILLPRQLFAFVLKDRKWAVVDINNITELPESTSEAWDSLVLPGGHKEMVYSLVQSHFRSKNLGVAEVEMQTDLIRGKGKGLIILLHGAPGVGKTSTAECVADLCKRPLYPITCGDLGITAVEVETRLKRIFVQAQKWECVLLLDEADVFLSERTNNVKHNSLVSVFLRILEYYKGILFLTTNRVGRMDEAFRSRVHVSLYYPPLNEKSTLDIFKINIQRTGKRMGEKMKVDDADIKEFALDHYRENDQRVRWNGRQIRNAFHIAVALAQNDAINKANRTGKKYRAPTLRAKHFDTVEKASSEFDNYLKSVLGMGQADRAKQEGRRRDDWSQEESYNRGKNDEPKAKRSTKKRRKYVTSESSDDSSNEEEIPKKGSQQSSSEEPESEQEVTIKRKKKTDKKKRSD
ncbi:aaa family atpase [Fusarium mexicanum]|uniref:Aaa family atpase n=1 Tax=Fusarium mexicanum TaxID=751941 RepID=A0A8H5JAG6_9HYPO|nr:aaa family atpase [Fusarium mexicanum]